MLKSIKELNAARFKNNWSRFVTWLWIKRDVDCRFFVGVLQEENRKIDDSLPSPALSHTDSINLFYLLEKKGLVFNDDAKYTYIINKVEEFRWDEFISELERPKWKRHWVTKTVISISAFLVAAVVGGIIGGYMHKVGENLVGVNPVIKCPTNIPTQATQSGGSPKQ